MTIVYTEDDVKEMLPGHLPLVGTDVEVCANRSGNDVVVHVNKGGILICRIRLQQAAADISGATLMQFSTFAPDFVFKVGDSREGMERLKRSLGVA